MKTMIVSCSDACQLEYAVELLKEGEVVAIPTETVYGLAANALSASAVRKIFAAKNRPVDNPLIVHISSMDMLLRVAREIPDSYAVLIEKFWPGPISFLLPKSADLPAEVTAGLDTVVVRFPSHATARYLIEKSNCPLAAPSANLSGRPSPTLASHVLTDLDGCIPCIVDGGMCMDGIESTVVNLLCDPPLVLRPGSITIEMLRTVVPNITLFDPKIEYEKTTSYYCNTKNGLTPICPGMKYVHYSPRAKFILIDRLGIENDNAFVVFVQAVCEMCMRLQKRGSLILPSTYLQNTVGEDMCSSLEIMRFSGDDLDSVARELFSALRWLDAKNVDFILMLTVEKIQKGLAIMNRAEKASILTVSADSRGIETMAHVLHSLCE